MSDYKPPKVKHKTRRAYDPDGRKIVWKRPEGGVPFQNTPGGVISVDDVPEGAGTEAILKAIRKRRQMRENWRRDKAPNRAKMVRRDI